MLRVLPGATAASGWTTSTFNRDTLQGVFERPDPVPATQHGCDGRHKQGSHDKGIQQDADYHRKAQLRDLHHRVAGQACEACGHDQPAGRHHATRERNRSCNPSAVSQLLHLFADPRDGQDVEVLA